MLKRLCRYRPLLIAAALSFLCCFFYLGKKQLNKKEVLFPRKDYDQIKTAKSYEVDPVLQTKNEIVLQPTVSLLTL